MVETPDNFDGLLNVTSVRMRESLVSQFWETPICLESVPVSHTEDPRKMLHGFGREKIGVTVCHMSRPSP